MTGHRLGALGALTGGSNVGIRRWWQRRCAERATLNTYTIARCELRLDHPDNTHAIFRGFDALTWQA